MTEELDLKIFNVLKKMFSDKFPEAVKSHTNSAKENILQIEQAFDENDADKLEHAAHSLKGASGQFGAKVLSELARQIEFLAMENKINEAKEILPEIKLALEKVEILMSKELEG